MKLTTETDRFLPIVQCEVHALWYDFQARRGVLNLPPGTCTGMDGCIELFTAIDPEVRLIETVSGTVRDTTYERRDGTW